MKKILLISLAVVLALSVSIIGCTSEPEPDVKDPIKIGCLFPATGRDAIFSLYYNNCVNVALDMVDWEIAGRPVEVIIEDEGYDPSVALDKAKKLVETDGVHVIFGPLSSESITAIGPYSEQMGVPLIPAKSTPADAIDFDYYVGLGNEYQYGYPLAWYAYDELGYRTATTLTADFGTGNLLMEAFKEAFEAKGGTVVQMQQEFFVVDFAPYLNQLEMADVMVAWPIGTGPQFIAQYAERGLLDEMPIITPIISGMSDPFLSSYMELGDNIVGIIGTDAYCSDFDYPTNTEFVAAYEARTGSYPDSSICFGAVGLYIIIQTLEAMGGSTDAELWMDTILSTEYDTPAGTITFDPDTKWANMNMFVMDTVVEGGVCQPELLKVYNVGVPPVE